jgi:hypothetical protein
LPRRESSLVVGVEEGKKGVGGFERGKRRGDGGHGGERNRFDGSCLAISVACSNDSIRSGSGGGVVLLLFMFVASLSLLSKVFLFICQFAIETY